MVEMRRMLATGVDKTLQHALHSDRWAASLACAQCFVWCLGEEGLRTVATALIFSFLFLKKWFQAG